MSRRRKRARDVRSLPFVVEVTVHAHRVHVAFADDGTTVAHVEHHQERSFVSGADREHLAALVIQGNDHLDLKTDHERIYERLWG